MHNNNPFKRKLNNLKIISPNVNSLVNNYKRMALLNLLDTQNLDIALLNETKLNEKHTLFFRNYNCIRNDRANAKRRGIAMLIKKQIKYDEIIFPER